MNKVNKEFHLLRHGQTDFNVQKVVAGPYHDISLNDTGRQQAKKVRSSVAKLPLQTICHSPMIRVLETMDLAAKDHACERIEIEWLRECTASVWGKLRKVNPNDNPCEETAPFFEQVKIGLEKSLSHPAPTLIVAHGGIHYAICHHLNIADHPWEIDNCALVHFIEKQGQWQASLI